jgi:hypothetical protein
VAAGWTAVARVISDEASIRAVRGLRVRVDLALLREGLAIGREFGVHSLEEMARLALYLSGAVYDAGSLRRTAEGVEFALYCPPLRVGAFQRVGLVWDGRPIAPPDGTARPADAATPVRFDAIDRARPLVLPVGRRVEFTARMAPPPDGPHTIRLELQSVAIPPLVWFQVTDRLGPLRKVPP